MFSLGPRMAEAVIDLLSVGRGSITAPAGCGKTELIKSALCNHNARKPVLILTHTNAGVAALRARLERSHVSPNAYRLATIDGWAMRTIGKFPRRSGHDPKILLLDSPQQDYPAIRDATWRLLHSNHLDDVVASSYAHVIVDEYQDCSLPQHYIVEGLARLLPTCVLGDPLQAIFGFAGPLVHWERDVLTSFPSAGALGTPWRWKNADTEPFGNWLLQVRDGLMAGEPVDLRRAPPHVQWIQTGLADDHRVRLAAAQTASPVPQGRVLVIGDARNPRGQRDLASQTPGAITVEAVDLRDLMTFGRDFALESPQVFETLVGFAGMVMTNLGAAEIQRRFDSLRRGTARNAPTPAEQEALGFADKPSFSGAARLLETWGAEPDVRSHRPAILYAAIKALRLAASGTCDLLQAVVRTREESRFKGRPLPRRAVGSTLLLKGLEAEVAVILDATTLNAANLYVAMTRGSMRLVVCSPTPILQPARP